MKKSMILFLIFSLLLLGCSSRPPLPELSNGKINIPVELGTYSWKTLMKHVIADAPGPSDLTLDVAPVLVKPNAEVFVKFSNQPDSMTLSKWAGNEVIEDRQLTSNSFNLPLETGEHIYSLRAIWGKYKSGVYAFKVKVE